jgi:hypothetical protein
MAEIKNYTLNFACGRSAQPRLTFSTQKLACAEIQCDLAGALE